MAAITELQRYTVDGVVLFNESTTRTSTGGSKDHRQVTVTQAGEVTFTLSTDIGNAREVVIKNKDATNFIKVGFATGVYYIYVYPGKTARFDLTPAHAALFMIADTADCEAEVFVHED